MNLSSFIAKRIAFNKQKSFSRFIIRLATIATAISVAAMIIASSFVVGFQTAISQKIFSFWGHIRVQQDESAQMVISDEAPSEQNAEIVQLLQSNKEVKKVQPFATKSAVIEHNKDIEGILVKGVDNHYDFGNLQSFLQKGNWINFSDTAYSKDIVVSQFIADELNIRLNDSINIYFISSSINQPNRRKLHVAGIYKTGIEEYDERFVLSDIRLLRKVNGWQDNEIGGYEVFLKDYHKMDTVSNALNTVLPSAWSSYTIREIFPNIFDWLDIQDVNKVVIYIIMSIVAIINLITCLLILVLERMKMTGVLKALGSSNWLIQKIFLYYASIVALRGVLYGFVFGVGLCLLQKYTGILKLDESAYYVRVAPIEIVWTQVLVICVATFFVCYLSLILPTIFIRKIQPVKAIKFD